MSRHKRRIALLEEAQNPIRTRPFTDTELALRLYWAVNGPDPITERLLEIIPQLADLTAPAAKADPSQISNVVDDPERKAKNANS
jgi:hypothetical protein